MNMRLLLPLLGLLRHLSVEAEPRTEILPLHYRTTEELLPLAESVVGSDGQVSAHGNQLIVNAEPEKIAELQSQLPQLDSPPRRLLITLDTQQDSISHRHGYRVDGRLDAGNVGVIGGRGERDGRDQIRIISRSTNSNRSAQQQIQATEGYPARIQVGQSVPLTTYSYDAFGYPSASTEYRDVNQGFEVIANVHGDQVELSIRSQQDRLSNQPGVIDTQSFDTRVRGRLGEWISLGGVSEGSTGSRTRLLSQQYGNAQQTQALRLKVELLE